MQVSRIVRFTDCIQMSNVSSIWYSACLMMWLAFENARHDCLTSHVTLCETCTNLHWWPVHMFDAISMDVHAGYNHLYSSATIVPGMGWRHMQSVNFSCTECHLNHSSFHKSAAEFLSQSVKDMGDCFDGHPTDWAVWAAICHHNPCTRLAHREVCAVTMQEGCRAWLVHTHDAGKIIIRMDFVLHKSLSAQHNRLDARLVMWRFNVTGGFETNLLIPESPSFSWHDVLWEVARNGLVQVCICARESVPAALHFGLNNCINHTHLLHHDWMYFHITAA